MGEGKIEIIELFPKYLQASGYSITSSSQLRNDGAGKFTLLPGTTFEKGKEYELVIYSKTFAPSAGGTPIFIDTDKNKRMFRYRFKIFDVEIQPIGLILAGSSYLTVTGDNFQYFQPNSLIDIYQLKYVTTAITAANITLSGSDCSDALERSATIASFSQQSMLLTNINLNGCTKGKVYLSFIINRNCQCIDPSPCSCQSVPMLSRIDDQTFYRKQNTIKKVFIGTLGCDPTCLDCFGTSSSSCKLCDSSSKNKYFYQSQCLTECPSNTEVCLYIILLNRYIAIISLYIYVNFLHNEYIGHNRGADIISWN